MYRAISSGLGRHLDQMRGPEATTADIYDDPTWQQRSLGAFGAVNAVSLNVERGRVTFDVCISMPRRAWHVLHARAVRND